MHRMLYVEEILREIFSNLLFRSLMLFSHSPRRDALALATTCRAFKEPALDILWEELPSLAPLVRCLPGASSMDSIGVRPFRYLSGKKVIQLSTDVHT